MTGQPKIYLTPAEYLAVERQNEYRSEYIDGEMVAMTGASRRHNITSSKVGLPPSGLKEGELL